MNTIEIDGFDDVIMYALQRDQKERLYFGDIWGLCEAAAPQIQVAISPEKDKKLFVQQMLASVESLENANLINRHTKDAGERLSHITLTTEGDQYVTDAIFSAQSRMGVVKPRPERPPSFPGKARGAYRNPTFPRRW